MLRFSANALRAKGTVHSSVPKRFIHNPLYFPMFTKLFFGTARRGITNGAPKAVNTASTSLEEFPHSVDEKTLLLLKKAREIQAALPDKVGKDSLKFSKEMTKEEWEAFSAQSRSIKKNSSVY
jgi:hypothetical protein